MATVVALVYILAAVQGFRQGPTAVAVTLKRTFCINARGMFKTPAVVCVAFFDICTNRARPGPPGVARAAEGAGRVRAGCVAVGIARRGCCVAFVYIGADGPVARVPAPARASLGWLARGVVGTVAHGKDAVGSARVAVPLVTIFARAFVPTERVSADGVPVWIAGSFDIIALDDIFAFAAGRCFKSWPALTRVLQCTFRCPDAFRKRAVPERVVLRSAATLLQTAWHAVCAVCGKAGVTLTSVRSFLFNAMCCIATPVHIRIVAFSFILTVDPVSNVARVADAKERTDHVDASGVFVARWVWCAALVHILAHPWLECGLEVHVEARRTRIHCKRRVVTNRWQPWRTVREPGWSCQVGAPTYRVIPELHHAV